MRDTLPVLTAIVLALSSIGATVAPNARSQRAHRLVEDAQRRFAEGSFGQRRIAIRELETAALLVPTDTGVLDALGRAYLDASFLHLASVTFKRILRLEPHHADASFGLGQVEKRDWLETTAPASLRRAIDRFDAATRERPDFCEAWTALAALRFEKGDRDDARRAAMSALATTPERPTAQLAAAYHAYWAGHLALAESLFAVAIPGLPPAIAARFADITPLVTQEQGEALVGMEAGPRAEAVRRFWSQNDPDPTSRHPQAQLEFWSRLAHATLLLGDAWGPHWQGRTELYARYGRGVQVEGTLHRYEMPHLDWGEYAPTPAPEALARLDRLVASSGRAVFAPLPPGVHELPVASLVSRFEGERGARLVAEIETPGSPTDSITADCVVLDWNEHEVARVSQTLSPSACDPAALRTAEFSFELPAGRYRLAFAVRDGRDGCGLLRVVRDVAPVSSALSMSDIVLTCGLLDPAGPSVRLNPDLAARVQGALPLFAYFEIYRLRTGAQGRARFEYEYTVHAPGEQPRRWYQRLIPGHDPASRLSFRTTQEGIGPLRRQYIRVPVASLAPGRYRLAVTVRDATSGAKVEGWTDFVKSAPAPSATSQP